MNVATLGEKLGEEKKEMEAGIRKQTQQFSVKWCLYTLNYK